MKHLTSLAIALVCCATLPAQKATTKKEDEKASPLTSALGGLKFRSIGPAVTSGRVADVAVNPRNKQEWYIAAASGGVWKTTNAGTTFQPVFDNEGSYSIGCVTIDPNNPNVVWVGSGENNNQRAVAYGDGLYKSEDAGKSWKNVGLKTSEHIGMVAVNPRNSNEVFVAAYGPLWSNGGERGIYHTTDGGVTWKRVLHVSDYTGFNEVYFDPFDATVLYAAAHQRQRKVFTYVGGGPESAVYRSSDGGATWSKIMSGLPSGDIGRIGLAPSKVVPNLIFAIVEAADGSGVYKSTDRGASWSKQSSYSTSGNYYQEIFTDPKDADRLYVPDVFFQHSRDGGKTWSNLGEDAKHVDNHVIWVDEENTDHKLVGCDGGLYETFDDARTWRFFGNLPITQFYRVGLDNSKPFYYVYGGTQDNFSLGGPSQTISGNGIANSDWFVTNGGDGFESVVDWKNPNTVYAESQYGGLVRYDRASGEILNIQPTELKDEAANRFNWDAPLIISRHNSNRLYFASQKIFRTNDQGGTWTIISPDLSRGVDRNKLKVMDRVWSVDAVAKNQSTDIFGQVTGISESPLDENLLLATTDDGLLHLTTDGGKNWKKIDKLPGVPDMSYGYFVQTSAHNKNTMYAIFNNHRYADYKPYFYRSTDGGNSWNSISGNLPGSGAVYCMAEDPRNANLLFCGTEYGAFATLDGGKTWHRLKGGLPTIAVRDMEIQPEENDLVLATFGRGFYVLDDYSPLRELAAQPAAADKALHIFKVSDARLYEPALPLGIRDKGFLGHTHFATPNPEPGAVITLHQKETVKTLRDTRKEAERNLVKNNNDVYYPSMDSLRIEDAEQKPYILLTIEDEDGNAIRQMTTPATKGIQRVVWDMRYTSVNPVRLEAPDYSNPFSNIDQGARVVPGTYRVKASLFSQGKFTPLDGPVSFNLVPLKNATLAATDQTALNSFNRKVARLQRAANGSNAYLRELNNRVRFLKQAALVTPGMAATSVEALNKLDDTLRSLSIEMNGDNLLGRYQFETLPGLSQRINGIAYSLWSTTAAPTGSMNSQYDFAAGKFETWLASLRAADAQVVELERKMEAAGAPYTPGRLPVWKRE